MNLQRLRHEILDFVTALFMGNLPFGGHSTVYYRPEDCYTGPFTLCKAVHSPLHCLRCVCVKHSICVCVCVCAEGGEITFVERLQVSRYQIMFWTALSHFSILSLLGIFSGVGNVGPQ